MGGGKSGDARQENSGDLSAKPRGTRGSVKEVRYTHANILEITQKQITQIRRKIKER